MTGPADKHGPYISEGCDEFYLLASEYTLNEARHEAAGWARELSDEWGRSRYVGRRWVPLHDHQDWESCESCPDRKAWCFDIYEAATPAQEDLKA